LGSGIAWPALMTVFLNMDARTTPALNVISGFVMVFRLFLLSIGVNQSVRSYKMIEVYKLLADAEYTRPCEGAKSDALGEAI